MRYFCNALFCLTSSFAFAEDVSSRITALEARMTAIKMETATGTVGAQLASASPLFDGYGLFLTADLLLWHLYEGGTDYSLTRHVSGSQNFPTISGKSSRVHFNWSWGFRVGMGYNFEHDRWDSYLNFTWFQTDAVNHAHRRSNETLVPQKGEINTVAANRLKAHWNVHNYVLDFELGRRYFVSKFLAFRPQFGLETAWIFQHRHFTFHQPIIDITRIDEGTVHGKCNFWGIGPRAGLEGSWFLGRHFSLFGAINGALLWGQFETKDIERTRAVGISITQVDIKDNFHRLVPNAQLATGIGWDSNIANDRFHLGIRLAYEFQYWWRQNQFLNEEQILFFGLQHESRDMTLNGATLDVRFDF